MRRLLTGFLAAALCLTLTACWDPEPVSEEQDFWAVTTSEPAQEDTPIRPTAFTLPYINSQTLDPISCSDGVQQVVGSLLYESLFVLDEHFTPRPHLCASYSVSSNGLTYAFTLRDGVTFSDGTSLGAADVFATLRRAQVSERYAARFENVASPRANRGEVVVTLKQADSALPALLDIPIVKSGSEKDAVPLGTGPYFFLTDSDGPCLMRNDGWWYGEQLPLERIDLTPAKDADSAVYLFSAGRAHLLPADLLSEGTASGLNDVDIADAPTGTLLFLGFNTRREQTADRALRAAMDAAVDRDALVTTLLAGHAAAARFPISPASPLYPKEPAPAYGSDDYPGMLAALFAAPDAAEGDADAPAVELTLLANEENPFKVSLAEYLARELSKGPVSVTPVVLSWTEYLEALGSGEFDLWLGEVRLTADWNVAPLVGTGGALNYGGYSDPETDAAIRSFLADESAETSAALCARLAEESPILPLMFKAVSVLTPKGMVEGIAPTAANPFANLDRWSLRLPE